MTNFMKELKSLWLTNLIQQHALQGNIVKVQLHPSAAAVGMLFS